MNKYEKLWNYINSCNKSELKICFDEIKNICGFNIDHSFLNSKKELKDFGYEVEKVSLKEKYVLFKKIK